MNISLYVLKNFHYFLDCNIGTVYGVLSAFGISPKDVKGHMRDTVAMNGAMDNILRKIGQFDDLISVLCISHLLSNAGHELMKNGCHPVLNYAWAIFQKVLKSDAASNKFAELAGETVMSYSDIKWWSKFDCVNQFRIKFDVLLEWAEYLVNNNIAPQSAYKLLDLLSNPSLLHYLKVEMSAYCFVSTPMRHVTYLLEGDSEDVFRTTTAIENHLSKFEASCESPGDFPFMPEVHQLGRQAIAWATSTGGAAEASCALAE